MFCFLKGWEELYKQYIEKQWADRSKEFQEKGSPKLLRWDPGLLSFPEAVAVLFKLTPAK